MFKTRTSVLINKLRRYCKKWGGEHVYVSEQEFKKLRTDPSFSEAGFVAYHGVDWDNKIIYTIKGITRVGALIHEMGHVFAAKEKPDYCAEIIFLGWEARLASTIGAYKIWSSQNWDYMLGNNKQWSKLTTKEQKEYLTEYISIGREEGILDIFNRPLAIR